MQTAERRAVVGSPDLGSLTTSHIERAFLFVRQELKRFQRKGLGFSKDLEMHKYAVALYCSPSRNVENNTSGRGRLGIESVAFIRRGRNDSAVFAPERGCEV
jgi:hypothetical protein